MVSKRSFVSVFSSLSVVAGVLTLAPSAFAACPDPDPGALPYAPARAVQNVCTTAALKAFDDALDDPSVTTWPQVEAKVTAASAACSACIFSNETDSNWGPIIKITDGADVGALANYGACFEKAPGGSLTCGTTIQKFDICVKSRCYEGAGYCTTQQAYDTCVSTVVGDANSCGQYNYVTACPNYATLETACGDLRSVITVMCGGTFPTSGGGGTDAGVATDAGTDAGIGGGIGTKDGGLTKTDAGSLPKTDAGKKDAAASGDDDDDTAGDDDDDTTDPKKDAGKAPTKKADENEDEDTSEATTSGCAQSGSASGSSVASAMVLMFAVGSILRARRRSKR